MQRRTCTLLVACAVLLLACAVLGEQASAAVDANQQVIAGGAPDAGSTPEETTRMAGAGDAADQPLDAETEAIRQRIEGMNDEELKELLAQQEERLAALQAHIANTTDDGTADESASDEGEGEEDETGGEDEGAEGGESASSEMDALVGVLKAFKQRLVASASQSSTPILHAVRVPVVPV
jgi:hypothetical protein